MTPDSIDRRMMAHCLALSKQSRGQGEYPYAAVICRNREIVAETVNRLARDHDVTHHAEVVAIGLAQQALGTANLEDCEIYTNAEPCAMCCYAIREARIRRVVYGLASPHMGGVSRWNILGDPGLSKVMPEVFAPPPEIVAGFMAEEAAQALREWNPVFAGIILERGIFRAGPVREMRTEGMRKG
ncbi:MAG TPA: nucleoside deaminase [Pseudorhodoplanes sp.]|jgi:tRNA(adenine34) deaminase|nr:nucleoside deaminase [Pseudorhodoplanes sp.]